MSPRSLFTIILKVVGIVTLSNLLIASPPLVLSFLLYGREQSVVLILFGLVSAATILWVAYMLIFKADSLVSRFALDSGLQEKDFNIQFDQRTCLRVALFIVGVFGLCWELPNLVSQLYNVIFPVAFSVLNSDEVSWRPVVLPVARVIISLLLIGERNKIVDYFLRGEKTAPEVTTLEVIPGVSPSSPTDSGANLPTDHS